MATSPEEEEEPRQQPQNDEDEARRLKSIAEAKFASSNLKSALKHAKKAHRLRPDLDGLAAMLTALKILRVTAKGKSTSDPQGSNLIDYYKVLQVEPFSHINTLKKQYKKLALVLHPDKSGFSGCGEAFKVVGEGFKVLSDKIRRKEYDMRLRIRLQERASGDGDLETFWTACSRCRLLHQFERRYLGHSLVCPSCKMSFEAAEVEDVDKENRDCGGGGGGERVLRSERLRKKAAAAAAASSGNRGIGDVGSFDLRGKESGGEGNGVLGPKRKVASEVAENGVKGGGGEKIGGVGMGSRVGGDGTDEGVRIAPLEGEVSGAGEWGGGRLRTGGLKRKMSTVDEVLERSESKRVKFAEETMTLAEMQLQVKQNEKAVQEKEKMKEKQKIVGEKEREKEKEKRKVGKKVAVLEIEGSGVANSSGDLEIERRRSSRKGSSSKIARHRHSRSGDLENMVVEESDFYDFNRDRMEKSFRKGQVWAMYDDDGDGMPRHYGFIDDVVSVNPFQLNLSLLNLQTNGDEAFLLQEKMGIHPSCGRFKLGRKKFIKSLDIFSHVVDCERAAREVYRIYPRKGSVWALYNEAVLGDGRRNQSPGDKPCYDIVVFLTTYNEVHGLSMAYLEKVDGFKTVFKRREVGCHTVRLLGKDDIRLISHQIPARKLSGDEATDLLKDCWELDPASLPQDLR